MNIVLVSDHEVLGGAAQSTCRLTEGLCRHERVSRIVLHPEGAGHSWRTWRLTREEPWLRRQIQRVPRRLWPGRFPRPATHAFAAAELARVLKRLRPDIVNIHNLHGGAGWGWGVEFARVAASFAPVVWTLHDMWSFTGRCAYSYDCTRFRSGCGADCPTAAEAPSLPAADIAPAWQARQTLLGDTNLVAVTPSRWLARQAESGLWRGHRIEVIPYGVPIDRYRSMPRADARRKLGHADDGPVLLVAAVDLTERRKGGALLGELWRCLNRPVTLLTMGRGEVPATPPHVRVRSLGWLDGDEARALAYNAADLLLHPAPVDNLPNVVLEALACGTPVVALPIGGVPEAVRPGVSGWLATQPSAAALAMALQRALADLAAGCDLRSACRRIAEREHTLELQASRYRQLFEALATPVQRGGYVGVPTALSTGRGIGIERRVTGSRTPPNLARRTIATT